MGNKPFVGIAELIHVCPVWDSVPALLDKAALAAPRTEGRIRKSASAFRATPRRTHIENNTGDPSGVNKRHTARGGVHKG